MTTNITQMAQPWDIKYRPKTLSEVQGQDSGIKQLKDFVLTFKKRKKKDRKAALIYGPVGCGKTSSIYALANDLGYDIIEINASDARNSESINNIVGGAIHQMSLFGKGKIILIDEVGGIAGREDRGGIQTIIKMINSSTFPIIMTTINLWDKKIAPLRKKSVMMQYRTLSYISVYNVLKKICKKEKIKYNDDSLKMLARISAGDMRAAINDLQTISGAKKEISMEDIEKLPQRERVEKIFNALLKIFKTKDIRTSLKALNDVDEFPDKILLWMDENVPKEYKKIDEINSAYNYLSLADIFKARIRRWQYWRFLVYMNFFMTVGVSLSKEEKYKRFVRYSPPSRIFKMWQANMKYEKRKHIAGKIAKKLYSSPREIIKDTLPYIQIMCKKSKKMAKVISEEFDLTKEEMNWMVENIK